MDDLRGGSSDTARGLRQRGARGRGAELETLAKEPGRHRPRLSVAALGWIAVPTLLLLGIVGAPSAAWLGLAAGLAVLGVLAVVQRRRVARAATPPLDPGRATCPTCNVSYPPGRDFCPRDGNRLLPATATLRTRGAEGTICVVCARGFDPGAGSCPEHGDTLVAAPLFELLQPLSRGQTPSSGESICPTCGVRALAPTRFCEADGTELKPLH